MKSFRMETPTRITTGPTRPPKIRVLDPHVAERIAAGEVIERPASVIKELIENSLDAGATEIAVILEDGGKGLIEVIDNGHGMDRDDLAVALKRHATSKLTSLDDLEKISTLGFRGEALPSVAAVSDLSLLSRAKGENASAYELSPQDSARAVTFGHFLGSPHGTRIQARGLFSQIPARLKFLKSQNAEVGQVREWIERLALAHPRVSFRLVSGDRTVLTLKAQSETDRVRAILADGEDYPVVTAQSETDATGMGLNVRVHWLQGLSTPQTRKLVQVVNGRALRDKVLQQALLSPFRQALLPGQFPAAALFIEINPAQIDVNVHPTKTEVRFLESRKVFHAVQSLVESMIVRNGAPAYVPTQISGFVPGNNSGGFAPASATSPLWTARESAPFEQTSLYLNPNRLPEERSQRESNEGHSISSGPTPAPHPLSSGRLAGLLFNTYFVYELQGELALVDQHAADERIRYERLRRRVLEKKSSDSQALLLPEAVRFAAESRTTL